MQKAAPPLEGNRLKRPLAFLCVGAILGDAAEIRRHFCGKDGIPWCCNGPPGPMALAKREAVLSIALLLAVVSACFVPPSAAYFGYIDWNTLALLFSLMVVMKGVPAGGGVSLPGQWAAAAGAQHPCPAGGAGVPPLWTEHGGDQRRGAAHLCALWTVGAANGRGRGGKWCPWW